ncbi:hypothetical protein AVEN_239581-1 [Araneus ventricosus]|uniref:Uncharacterized protein n=1 Tax=Araneus ventricosus TaxID=182803 RepID=A0A4Y2TI05_ARAVE|nr:hypothetical protein AVEN_239581-1 [Araneus ventricosus]
MRQRLHRSALLHLLHPLFVPSFQGRPFNGRRFSLARWMNRNSENLVYRPFAMKCELIGDLSTHSMALPWSGLEVRDRARSSVDSATVWRCELFPAPTLSCLIFTFLMFLSTEMMLPERFSQGPLKYAISCEL